jgi:hypothetical protein
MCWTTPCRNSYREPQHQHRHYHLPLLLLKWVPQQCAAGELAACLGAQAVLTILMSCAGGWHAPAATQALWSSGPKQHCLHATGGNKQVMIIDILEVLTHNRLVWDQQILVS